MFARLQAEWRLKALLFVALGTAFWSCYLFLSRRAYFPLRAVPVTGLDEIVPFQPEFWAWIYLSNFLATSTLPFLLPTREAIRRYASSVWFIGLSSFAVFLFFPTQGPRPADIGGGVAMRFIAHADGTLNALPSLHAAFVVCVASLARRMFGPKVLPVAVLWGGAILYATLATKQHYALDLLAGGALGWGADWLAWRGASAEAMICVSSGTASQRGAR